MSEVGARPRWRDALAAGCARRRDHRRAGPLRPRPRRRRQPTAGGPASPSAEHRHRPARPPPSSRAPRRPTRPRRPPPAGGTCWDGRETASLKLCGLPDGARGLAWVFPSFARDRALCHQARPNDDSYPVVESYACFQQALGQPVTVTYDQVKDPEQVEQLAAGATRQEAPPDDPRRARRPLHLQGRRQPSGPDHRDVRAVPLRRLGLRRQPAGRRPGLAEDRPAAPARDGPRRPQLSAP